MPAAHPIRVLVADDSPTIRYHLTQLLNDAPQFQVIGGARNGEEAVQMTLDFAPHVVSMDVQMPIMDGLEATRHIMRQAPTPVVIVSGLVEREVDLSFRALQAGALAVIAKPPAKTSPDFDKHHRQLLSTIRAMSEVKVIRRWASVYEVARPVGIRSHSTAGLRLPPEIIAVAASAGGPSALATLLGGLKNHLTIPMVVVQHMPGEFMGGLARWLGKFTELKVKIVGHNEVLMPGVVHLAPGGAHLTIYRQGQLFVAQLDPKLGHYHHQPAADVLLMSVAEAAGERGVGIILTGMGQDGAAGLLAMYRVGARTYAQDEASCTVFGMPGAAIERDAVEKVMSPGQIATALRKLEKSTYNNDIDL